MLQQPFSSNICAAIAQVRRLCAMSPADLIVSRLFNDSFAKSFSFNNRCITSLALSPILLVAQFVATNGTASAQQVLAENSDILAGNSGPNDFTLEKSLIVQIGKRSYVYV